MAGTLGRVIDDGLPRERAADEPDLAFASSDEVPVFPNDDTAALPEMIIDFGESPLGDGLGQSPSPREPELAFPEDLWGQPREEADVEDALDLEIETQTPVAEVPWPPEDPGHGLFDETSVTELLEHGGDVWADVDARPSTPVAGPPQRRPTLAPPVPVGRWKAMRQSGRNLQVDRRLAAAGLGVLAAAGLFLMSADRSPDQDGPRRQIVSAGTQPVTSVPAPTLPRGTTAPAPTPPAAEPAPGPGQGPTTLGPDGSSTPQATTGQARTGQTSRPVSRAPSATTPPATPRSNALVAASPPQQPPPPPAPPAPPAEPAPPDTEVPAFTPAPVFEEPEASPTTRRPRATIPVTTAVPNTTPPTTPLPPPVEWDDGSTVEPPVEWDDGSAVEPPVEPDDGSAVEPPVESG